MSKYIGMCNLWAELSFVTLTLQLTCSARRLIWLCNTNLRAELSYPHVTSLHKVKDVRNKKKIASRFLSVQLIVSPWGNSKTEYLFGKKLCQLKTHLEKIANTPSLQMLPTVVRDFESEKCKNWNFLLIKFKVTSQNFSICFWSSQTF